MAPVRTCIGCRQTSGTDQLVRVARGGRSLLVGHHQPGRGAWLCRDSPGCFERAVKHRAFDRALRRPVGHEELRQLRITLQQGSAGGPSVASEGSVP